MNEKPRDIRQALFDRKYEAGFLVSDTFLEKIDKAYKEKRKIFKWLFDDKDTFNIELGSEEINSMVSKHKAYKTLLNILKTNQNISMINIGQNTCMIDKNKYKISKLIPKTINNLNQKITLRYDRQIRKLSALIENFEKQPTDRIFNEILNQQNTIERLPCFIPKFNLQQFYSDLKLGNCQVSLLPEDIITCSTNAAFSSCYREGGEYHEGVFQYALDEKTLILTIKQINRIIGRQFIYIIGGNLIFGRIYGQVSVGTEDRVQKYIKKKFVDSHEVENVWTTTTEKMPGTAIKNINSYATSGGYGYFDLATTRRFRHKTLGLPWAKITLTFPTPILFNGKVMETRHRYCKICETAVATRQIGNVFVCDKCFTKENIRCDMCGAYIVKSQSIEFEKSHICRNCNTKIQRTCPSCGEHFSSIKPKTLCNKCDTVDSVPITTKGSIVNGWK